MKIFDNSFTTLVILIGTAITISLFINGCTERQIVDRALGSLKYFKDYRTNLCFAQTLDYNISNVPCTTEVEKLIVNTYPVLER